MTPAQLAALRAACFANTTAAAFFASPGNAAGLRDYLNSTASPAYTLWRTSVTQDEIMLNGFDWARVDNLTVGKARIWEWMFDNSLKTINPSKPNVRAGIDQTWVGTAADLAVRTAVYGHCKRPATVAEKMLASGTGSDAVPAVPTFEGEISDVDAVSLIYKDNGDIWTAQG
jgi:hypothetical protein